MGILPIKKTASADGYDVEKHSPANSTEYIGDEGAVHAETFVVGDSLYAKLQRFATKTGIEARGIERVPSDERTDAGMSKIGTLWLSANMVVSSFAIGALAYPIFYLGFVDTILTILFFNLLGIMPVCFFSTFGPRFGLRQMVLSRFYFGWYGVKISRYPRLLFNSCWSVVAKPISGSSAVTGLPTVLLLDI
jgi:purine-cytosine permease-like protein